MAVDAYAADEQADLPVDLDRWVTLARSVLEDRGVKGDAEVSLLFVDEPAIAALNEQFLGRPGPTDVLAFPIEDEPVPGGRSPDMGGTGPGSEPGEDPPTLLGDVVICPAVASRNAAAHGVGDEDELALLVVHGLLHLLGMDHEVDADAERMEHLERTLLARYWVPAPPGRPNPGSSDAWGPNPTPAVVPAPPGRPNPGSSDAWGPNPTPAVAPAPPGRPNPGSSDAWGPNPTPAVAPAPPGRPNPGSSDGGAGE